MAVVALTHHYPAPPQRVWALATDFAALARACRRFVVFDGLPDGRCAAGQTLTVRASLFGLGPWMDYEMQVAEMDDAAMALRSEEHGAGVKRWSHHLTVAAAPRGAALHDRIEIEAERSWQTPIFAAWARMLYRGRHKPRLQMLAEEGWSS